MNPPLNQYEHYARSEALCKGGLSVVPEATEVQMYWKVLLKV